MSAEGPSEQQIRDRAYELWERAGKPEGSANRFWFHAERDLEEARGATANGKATALRGKEPVGDPAAPQQVRPAGPEAMRDRPRNWDGTDEAADESFPSSDPPSGNHIA